MAIIYSYPGKSSPSGSDVLVITDSQQAAPNKNRTKSLTLDNLASYVITSQSGITGSGTINKIPVFTGATSIGDSIITQSTDLATVAGAINISGTSANPSIFNTSGIASATVVDFLGSAAFAPNAILRFGGPSAGLSIYQDDVVTGDSIISDTGPGNLRITGKAKIEFRDQLNGDFYAVFNDNAAVALYHNNIKKFETTTNGIEVTGAQSSFSGQVTIPITPVAGTDAASKAYVDGSVTGGTVTGTGTVNKLTKWSSGGTGIQNSNITDNGSLVTISSPTDQTGKAIFRTGIVLSSSPGGVTVDDTSMVIGAGNNDIISGADHCLAVGNNNQILTNSDNSISVGQGNTMTEGTACAIFGLSNTITGNNTITERCLVAGFSNSISAAKSSIVLGGSNSLNTNGGQGIILGSSNNISGTQSNDSGYILGNNVIITASSGTGLLQNAFGVGANLDLEDGQMVLGYRNIASSYPAVNYNQGLGETKFVLSVGTQTGTNSNALIITEGGVNRGTSSVAQVPRIVMPTVVGLNFADDTAAATGGIPIGGLYHNAGALRIRLT